MSIYIIKCIFHSFPHYEKLTKETGKLPYFFTLRAIFLNSSSYRLYSGTRYP